MMNVVGKCAVFLICLSLLSSCAKEVKEEFEVYSNTFESNDNKGVNNLKISSFNKSLVAGFYHNEKLEIEIDDLPSHDIAVIEFDLYIHDTWDGNSNVENEIGGPDIWNFKVDEVDYINTTFSNGFCAPKQHCPPQSYPSNYLNSSNNPRSGAYSTLPGVCLAKDDTIGSTWYKISKTIKHYNKFMKLTFQDFLVQKNSPNPFCDESWSIDNVRVRVIKL